MHAATVQGQATIKRPKSDGRCIHCRETLVETTRDHVFPSSWYPETTPDEVQRWTAPSCERCNGHYGRMEVKRLAMKGSSFDMEGECVLTTAC